MRATMLLASCAVAVVAVAGAAGATSLRQSVTEHLFLSADAALRAPSGAGTGAENVCGVGTQSECGKRTTPDNGVSDKPQCIIAGSTDGECVSNCAALSDFATAFSTGFHKIKAIGGAPPKGWGCETDYRGHWIENCAADNGQACLAYDTKTCYTITKNANPTAYYKAEQFNQRQRGGASRCKDMCCTDLKCGGYAYNFYTGLCELHGVVVGYTASKGSTMGIGVGQKADRGSEREREREVERERSSSGSSSSSSSSSSKVPPAPGPSSSSSGSFSSSSNVYRFPTA